ncbi:MAG TPA: alpha/beta hydrolase [Acidimicrobiales bacterium]
MPTVDVNATTLHYDRTGSGPPLLFVHGMCGDADVWAEPVRRLADRFTCVTYDRRGHSRSPLGAGTERPGAGTGDAQHADDAAALVEALDLAPCLVVGSSGGAVVALDLVLRHRRLLWGAVLSEPPLFGLDPDGGRALLGELGPRLDRAVADGGSRAAVDAFFSLVCPGLWSRLGEDRKDRYRANGAVGLADLRAPSLAVTEGDLRAVDLPVLVLTGDRSHPAFRSIAHRLADALPDARLVELAGSGHVTYAEQPATFAHAVAVFARDLGLDARPAGAARHPRPGPAAPPRRSDGST